MRFRRLTLLLVLCPYFVESFPSQCVKDLLSDDENGNYGGQPLLIFLSSTVSRSTLDSTLSRIPFSILLMAGATSKTINDVPLGYLILVGSDSACEMIIHEVERILGQLSASPKSWQPRLPFVIAVETRVKPEVRLAKDIFRLIWSYMVYNSAVLISDGGEKGSVYTADPFHPMNSCGKKPNAVEMIRNCSHPTRKSITMWTNKRVFPNCRIVVSARESPPLAMKSGDKFVGIDGNFVNLLSAKSHLNIVWQERINFSMAASSAQFLAYFDNVSRNEIDLALGGTNVHIQYSGKVFYVRPYAKDDICFYVAGPTPVTPWLLLTRMFDAHVLVMLVIIVFATGVLATQYQHIERKVSGILVPVGLLCQQPVFLPERPDIRTFIGPVALSFYVISCVYSTFIQSYALHPPPQLGVQTISELVARNFVTRVPPPNHGMIDTLAQIPVVSHLKMVKINDTVQALEELQEKRDFALLERRNGMSWLQNQNRRNIKRLQEVLFSLSITMITPEGSLYWHAIDSLVAQCTDYGLYNKWMSEFMKSSKRNHSLNSIPQSTKALSLGRMRASFTALGFGLFLATVAFLLELFHYRFKHQNHRS